MKNVLLVIAVTIIAVLIKHLCWPSFDVPVLGPKTDIVVGWFSSIVLSGCIIGLTYTIIVITASIKEK